MATLGIVLLWGGYTIGIFGFAKIKAAYGASPSLSISALALPSHRTTYLAAAATWGASTSSTSTGSSSSNINSSGGATAAGGSTTVGAGSPPTPTGAAYTNPFGS